MMPAEPSELYFDDGLVMTSTLSMVSAGSCSSICDWLSDVSPESFPFIQMVTPSSPLSDTVPSLSTSIDGMLLSRSEAEPPSEVRSWSALNILLSMSKIICGFSATISTSSSSSVSSLMERLSVMFLLPSTFIFFSTVLYPT